MIIFRSPKFIYTKNFCFRLMIYCSQPYRPALSENGKECEFKGYIGPHKCDDYGTMVRRHSVHCSEEMVRWTIIEYTECCLRNKINT